jgi:hypothetical protein
MEGVPLLERTLYLKLPYLFQTIVMSFRIEALNWSLAQAFGENFSIATELVHKRPPFAG